MNNKKIIKYKCHLSSYRGKMQWYCSILQKFGTFDKAPFLCLVCKCAKYLAFDTFGTSAMDALILLNYRTFVII